MWNSASRGAGMFCTAGTTASRTPRRSRIQGRGGGTLSLGRPATPTRFPPARLPSQPECARSVRQNRRPRDLLRTVRGGGEVDLPSHAGVHKPHPAAGAVLDDAAQGRRVRGGLRVSAGPLMGAESAMGSSSRRALRRLVVQRASRCMDSVGAREGQCSGLEAAARSGGQVWVMPSSQGYSEHTSFPGFVYLYGGFPAGSPGWVNRDWNMYPTTIDGSGLSASVV